MSTNLIRYDDGWGVVRGDDVLPLPGEYATTAEVLGEGVKAARELLADPDAPSVPLVDVTPLNPLPGARVYCQGANYRSHMVESGMDPDRAFNMLFTKSTASLSGAHDDIVTPPHVRLLDYEVELGLVIGAPVTGPVTVTGADLPDYVGAFVVANDVSARDVQLPQGQWYKGKSYRTFCPVGPYLCVPERAEVARWPELRLALTVNGERRQGSLAGDMVFEPAATLTEFSQLETFAVGDVILTGTPGGVAMQPPGAVTQKIAGLLPEARRWELFVRTQARSRAYLKPGDRVAASIRTDDGALDLGVQKNTVV
ncbi:MULTISPECIES: fumarylacetoacetate hydrolase family protein [Pseudonocardia]|uniref:Ureidoglycolate lyase n=2 Tax=Pseudonocardia TaxID=1847 RepID=A0A1Y2MPB1_PSEAH|nr:MULTISPECIES: fumarylacetoacetate hydrolase family protein [Pseudonocardia]OSY36991.1 Ureidoglycolate lyase [Pseudonocardia autotrophica]TDN75673.1 2-keto-4-pentenoate hydratase/2-oxohepta-3-ene-1,7-dioic acid hydratase in catechol pathway [Pseudonocardia autotrophica]BBF99646.1 fumarylacetoacetate hydrolase [Pseudonocardia autotrophica]GEC27708.1 fumarylacetoacetate hydrolase [Pseudonocardia saturnea]